MRRRIAWPASSRDADFNGSQVTYFVRLPDRAEMSVIVADPLSQPPFGLGSALELYWSPEDTMVLGPNIVPGGENMPGARFYVGLGS